MKITISTIPHDRQRYPTVGDWLVTEDGDISILVSDMGNADFEFLVALHELVEARLCMARGIGEEAVSRFDIEFEDHRPAGNTDEPGDHPLAPYRREHFTATNIERIMAAELNVSWSDYEAAVEALDA